MVRLSDFDRARALGQLQTRLSADQVANNFGITARAIYNLRNRYNATNSVTDRPRPGCPKVTTPHEDNFIMTNILRNRFQSGKGN